MNAQVINKSRNSQRPRISSVQLRKLREAQVQPKNLISPANIKEKRIPAKINTTPKCSREIVKLLPTALKLPVASKTGSGRIDPSQLGTQLLSDIKGIFKLKKESKIRTQYLLDVLADKKPWSKICNGKPIDARRLSSLMPKGIHSRDLRFADGSAFKGFRKEWFIATSNAKGKNSNAAEIE